MSDQQPDPQSEPTTEPSAPEPDPAFDALLTHIKEQRAFDFTGYKRASLQRRVNRRLEAVGLDSYEDYLDQLMVDPDEFTALFDTVLINVTGFFRDPEAWEHLRTVLLPRLLATRDGHPIRIWSAGCASGQEAYSVAMVLAELLGIDDVRERVKVYATDVDEDALRQARSAVFTEREVAGVPEDLRERWFERDGGRWTVVKPLRRAVIFGRNDLVQDAPISHVDLLLCRNTLMYFTAETQARILGRLHFALRPDGLLFLGKAEMLLSHAAQFQAVEIKRRFFRKLPDGNPVVARPGALALPTAPGVVTSVTVDRLQHAALTSAASPAQVVLDLSGNLVSVTQRATSLFGLRTRDLGRPIQDLELSYRPAELRAPIQESLAERHPIWIRDVRLARTGADALYLDVQLVPLFDDLGQPLGLSITFHDITQHRQLQRELELSNRQLETALEELQSSNEELETTNEELQSTVEELETTNEELQSTNEELETMNEELQSMNDEFQAGNDALRERQDEVDRLNQFMASVLGSMASGVVVVDAALTVLAWNTRAEDQWGVRADEAVGEHLMNLDIGLPVAALLGPLRQQLSGGAAEPETLVLDAVNRRGRDVRAQVTLTGLRERGEDSAAAMLVLDVTEA